MEGDEAMMGKKMMNRKSLLIGGMICLVSLGMGQAAYGDVRITEVFPGGVPGKEATSDWFELTNFGASSVDVTGWSYDDKSNDAGEAIFTDLETLASGESAVVLVSWSDDWDNGPDAVNAFVDHWGSENLGSTQIGYVLDGDNEGGGGLSGGGEQFYVYDSNNDLVDTKQYLEGRANTWVVDPSAPDGSLQEAELGEFGAFESATPVTNDSAAPLSVGSPGVVPEPASMALLATGAGALALRRRRRA